MATSLTYEGRICQCDFILERIDKISRVSKMTRYTNFKMRISMGEKDKRKKAFESNCESITIRLTFSDLHGDEEYCLNQFPTWQTSEGIWRKERHDNNNVKNAISPQHENRRMIFTGVSRIDSIPNRNCFTRIRIWGFISTGEHRSTKSNWERIAS